MAGRGLFGYRIPPRIKINGTGAINMAFVIPGFIPSKKNHQFPIIGNRKKILDKIDALFKQHSEGKINITHLQDSVKLALKDQLSTIVNSSKYTAWEKTAKEIILKQAPVYVDTYKELNFHYPVKKAAVQIYHYWTDNNIRDNSNKAEGIHDLFVACGIITDDSWQYLNPTRTEANLYRDEIRGPLTEITLTAFSW